MILQPAAFMRLGKPCPFLYYFYFISLLLLLLLFFFFFFFFFFLLPYHANSEEQLCH